MKKKTRKLKKCCQETIDDLIFDEKYMALTKCHTCSNTFRLITEDTVSIHREKQYRIKEGGMLELIWDLKDGLSGIRR